MAVPQNKTPSVILDKITPQGIHLHYGFSQFKKKSPAIKLRFITFFLIIRKQKTPDCNHFGRHGTNYSCLCSVSFHSRPALFSQWLSCKTSFQDHSFSFSGDCLLLWLAEISCLGVQTRCRQGCQFDMVSPVTVYALERR